MYSSHVSPNMLRVSLELKLSHITIHFKRQVAAWIQKIQTANLKLKSTSNN